ncbi:GTPase Era, mitochondrial isoform X2 [Cephus cinctus]|nr:GTPase Era, mitochondrial isoform X2 [Cephus cinctus]XP_024941797.1 GTPase Era, mitochondrial isoform X2 [Cephus cinctus]XP_024941798.1 GTPase Era, mitochondrial isoform X2 [Cephus cinctus]XP_024941799.1 GTPase Era, mitochondrial isoform X2 [Cephus cinctus]XP_024941800.1 GTPase Era, mitochondrial isoform X2 [Cephus cinctus]
MRYTGNMLIAIERMTTRVRWSMLRHFSTVTDTANIITSDIPIAANEDYTGIRRENLKSLNVAVLGMPNAGKSTLVNQLVCRPICPTSKKVHTTRVKASAIYCEDDTQLVFMDTPGLVTKQEKNRYTLEESFIKDPRMALINADVVGVIQDVSNIYTRDKINKKILEILNDTSSTIPSLLILNKVDTVKKKQMLLELTKALISKDGWPNFSDVFMVSALTGDGINDLREYLLASAKSRDWKYDPETFSDQPPEKILERVVQSKLLDTLPKELPYQMKLEIEHFDYCDDGSISALVIIYVASKRISSLLVGSRGGRIREIAVQAEQQLCNAFQRSVRLRLYAKVKTALE